MKDRNIEKLMAYDVKEMDESSSIIPDDLDELTRDLVDFAADTEGVPTYKGNYSREDIYFDHD